NCYRLNHYPPSFPTRRSSDLLLSVQLAPSRTSPNLSVSFSWNDVSAKVIEQEVTSKLEGVFNTVKGIKNLSSTSEKGKASITIEDRKSTRLNSSHVKISYAVF